MATITHSPFAFTRASASEFLGSSSNSVSGMSLKALGKAQLVTRTRSFTVAAKIRKVKKHEYPWPDNPDPNVKGGVLTHLSSFKPLKERPKPVTLQFEKPLKDLEKKIVDVRKMAIDTGLDYTDQIAALENKYQQALKDLYTHLSPIQRLMIARHPNRPTCLDYIFSITDKFVELHGDRAGFDDPAIVTGLGTIDDQRYLFIGQQKGRNTKENVYRNFAMPTPHGYRKALRMMKHADHHGFPIVTFLDTPGAFADLKSEALGQGEAIAHNIRAMFGFKVPIVSVVIGEGGSGGAAAIGCANKLLMLENSVFYVASPEACAAIIYKNSNASPKAAEKLKMTAGDLYKLQVIDGVIPEPLGGAHVDPSWTAQQIKVAICEAMDELKKMSVEELLEHRVRKYRKIGGFQEGIPVDPKFKVNMKKKDDHIVGQITDAELAGEVEKVRRQILDAKVSSSKPSELDLNEIIDKVKKEVDHEFSKAVKAMGLMDRLVALREEFSRVTSSKDQLLHPTLLDKIEKLRNEVNQRLSAAPNYESLRSKLDMLKDLSEAKNLSEDSERAATLKQEINKKFEEVKDQPHIKEKLESLKAEIKNSGIAKLENLPDELKRKFFNIKQEIESEVADALVSLGFSVEIVKSNIKDTVKKDLKNKVEKLNEEINDRIEDIVNTSDLKDMFELLRLEVVKAGTTPDPPSKSKIEALQTQIKRRLAEAPDLLELREKYEKLKSEILKKPSEGLDLKNGSPMEDNADARVEVNLGANSNMA